MREGRVASTTRLDYSCIVQRNEIVEGVLCTAYVLKTRRHFEINAKLSLRGDFALTALFVGETRHTPIFHRNKRSG